MERHRLDARGLLCPLPVLRARKMLRGLPPGDVLEVLATDPGAPRDFIAFCETTGYRLLANEETEGAYRLEIERTA